MQPFANDQRIVMTLDAGGTNFVFSAMQANRSVIESFVLPSNAHELERSLDTLIEGFRRVQSLVPAPPVAISFAFPGPCDYERGIIVNPPNLTGYRNVALGPLLEDSFSLPTFINNDGDLFTLGEATAGLLPQINALLEQHGSPKRFRNLLGFTLGTGLGGGIVRDGELVIGDNSAAGEVWLLRHKYDLTMNVEEGASLRAVRRAYASSIGIAVADAPEPKVINAIAEGRTPGDQKAALNAFRLMGEITGDAIAQACTLMDALVVLGGGVAGAHSLFLPALIDEMNSNYTTPAGEPLRRLIPKAFNLEDPAQLEVFLEGHTKEIAVPRSTRTVKFDSMQRTGVGVTRLGTSDAVAVGAYSLALRRLDSSTH